MFFKKNKNLKLILYTITGFFLMGFAAYVGTTYVIKASVEDGGSGLNSSSNYKTHHSTGQPGIAVNTSSLYKNYEGYIQSTYSYAYDSSVANNTPTANAGTDTTVYIGELVTLNGTSSSDPDGDQITYSWMQTSGNSVTLSISTASQPTFTPTAEGTYIFTLTVTDTGGLSSSDAVTVTTNYKYLLGDFDTDKDLDFDDLTLFALYWKNDNTSGDIGPRNTGETAPFYSDKVTLDSVIDYKDLLIFTFNWDYDLDYPAKAIKRYAPSYASYAITSAVSFDIGKANNGLYRIVSNGSSDFLGCWIRVEGRGCRIKSSNLSTQLAGNKFVMLTRNNEKYQDLNIVNLSKNNFAVSAGMTIAELEVEGNGNIEMSYLIKDNSNRAISYAVEQYSTSSQTEREVAGTNLGQNFPNPFNPETWIPFTLSEPGNVKIVIYNLVGQKIREISLGYLQAGEYKTKEKAAFWDGLNNSGDEVASGIYFYKLLAGSYSSIKRMVVLK